MRGRGSFIVLSLAVLILALTTIAAACGSGGSSTSSSSPSVGGGGATPQASSTTVAGVKVAVDPSLHKMLPQSVVKAGRVRVASDVPYPPWEMFTSPGSNQITGIDYDLGQALGAKLGIPFVFQNTVFNSIIPALQANKADIVMSNMYDNADRQKVLDFVDYAKDGSSMLVKKGNPQHITGLTTLAGKTIAVESGTTQLVLLQKIQAGYKANGADLTILQFPKDSDAQLAVRSGKAAADMTDQGVAGYAAKNVGGGNVFQVVTSSSPGGFDPQVVGIGMLKSSTQLRDAVQKALQSLISDGAYAKILAKYGDTSAAISTATINLK